MGGEETDPLTRDDPSTSPPSMTHHSTDPQRAPREGLFIPLRGGAVRQDPHDLLADLGCIDAQGDKYLTGHTPVLVDQAKQVSIPPLAGHLD